jgi:hypothetical protein
MASDDNYHSDGDFGDGDSLCDFVIGFLVIVDVGVVVFVTAVVLAVTKMLLVIVIVVDINNNVNNFPSVSFVLDFLNSLTKGYFLSQGIIVMYAVILQRLMSNASFIPLAPQVSETPLYDVVQFNHDFQAEFFF